MPKQVFIADFDRPDERRKALACVGALSGRHRIELTPYRARRSDPQNRWYWGCIVSAFYAFLHEQDYNINHPEQAHELIKAKFLTVDVASKTTGEVIAQRVRSTTELSTAEFSDYCERTRAWLLDFFGIVVPDPDFQIPSSMHFIQGESQP